MLKYFMQQDNLTSSQKDILLNHLTSSRPYEPFHLQCKYSKRKICFCRSDPISNMSDNQRWEFGKFYQNIQDYYEIKNKEDIDNVEEKMKIYKDKIRSLKKEEVIAFLKKNSEKPK